MILKLRTSNLAGAWDRLEAVCRRLWDENSASAVEVQAVIEEFKGEVHQVDAYVANTVELRALDLREHEEDLAAMRRNYEIEIAGLKKRLELQENALHDKDARAEDLLKTIARKEEENLTFHSQVLRMSASSDENKSKKMEEFYQELMKSEAAQTDSWQKRRTALEEESENRQKLLTARQAEIDAVQRRLLDEEELLKKRTTDVEIKSNHLMQEYRKKQQEIEDLKAALQQSITDLVRQYQARLRGADTEKTPNTEQTPQAR